MFPGVPHSEDFVRELLNLLVEQSWSVDGQPLNDQYIATQKNCGHIHFSTYMKQLPVLPDSRKQRRYAHGSTTMREWEGLIDSIHELVRLALQLLGSLSHFCIISAVQNLRAGLR